MSPRPEVPIGNAIAGLAYKLESCASLAAFLFLAYYADRFGWWKWPLGALLFLGACTGSAYGRKLFQGEVPE
jgi:uncharacterized membrane protein YfcA